MAEVKVEYLNYSYSFQFMGNQNGCPVRKENSRLGDGDIHTSEDSRKDVSVGASLEKITVRGDQMARVKVTYYVWEDQYGKKPSRDKLYLIGYRDCILPKNKYDQITQGNFIVSKSMTYELVSKEESCYYRDYFTGMRHDWCRMNEKYFPDSNRHVDWLSGNDIYVKMDDSGNEYRDPGNMGVKGTIILRVKRTTIVDKRPRQISRPTPPKNLNEILTKYPICNFKDGCQRYEPLKETPGRRGTYLRMDQDPRTINKFLIENGNENIFYPGNILATDGEFLTSHPTVINLEESERRPLSFVGNAGLYMGSNSNDPLKNIVPSLRNFNIAKSKFIYDYACACDDRNGLGLNVQIDEYTSDSAQGLTLGGTIKDVSFGLRVGEKNKKVHAFVLRQKLYNISLDNSYYDGNNVLNGATLNVDRFVNQLRGTAPAMISSVDYGRVAIIYVTSTDNTAFNAEIAGCKLSVGNSSRCQIKVKILGGPIAGYTRGEDLDGLAFANKIISDLYQNPVTGKDISTAVPIAFYAKYLSNMGRYVACNVLPYKQVYVETVRMRIEDCNPGVSFAGLKFRWLDYQADRYGNMGYVKCYSEKTPNCTHMISPKSVCLEFKVDARGGEWCDNNIFCPEVPIDQLRPDNDGYWTFTLKLTGSTLWSRGYYFYPTLPGCYRSTENSTYISKNGILDENNHRNYSKRDCLIKFYSWCEWHYRCKSYMYRLTACNYQSLAPFSDREVQLMQRWGDLRK